MKLLKTSRVGLLDCNNFFVSCERLFRPDLLKKPVIVLSNNDGCVIARSQEVKDIGVPMGVPYFQIKDIIKKHGIITFSSHLALYRDISRRVFTVMKNELGEIEQYSVDEAFFRVGTEPEKVARDLKKVIERQVGIPVSIGVSNTKTQAKYANSLAKKESGVCCLERLDWEAKINQITLREIWGVGNSLDVNFRKNGLNTVADLLSLEARQVATLFGENGLHLYQELSGIQVHSRDKNKLDKHKSLMSSRSFRNETKEYSVLADAIAYHVRHTAADLRKMKLGAKTIRVSLNPSRHGDFMLRGGSEIAILPASTNDTFELLIVANKLLKKLFETGVPYKKAGVTLGDFKLVEQVQTQLFETSDTKSSTELMNTLDSLNKKGNREVILLGSRLVTKSWQSKKDMCSPSYTTNWKDILVVKSE